MVAGRFWGIVLLALVAGLLAAAPASAADGCFGAAARDPLKPCTVSSKGRRVIPSPNQALVQPSAPCTPIGRVSLLYPCRFGLAVPESRTASIALVGDSHAAHWRAAVDQIARGRGVQAMSLTRSGCPFSAARAKLPEPEFSQCVRWNEQVRAWFADHPETDTVFISTHANGQVVRREGLGDWETAVRGLMAAWRSLPDTVQHVYVLRDVPRTPLATGECIAAALQRKEPPGPACASTREKVLRRDEQVEAMRRMKGPRYALLDLTPFFCSARKCYPVVGRVLVHKDGDHMTTTFARTLGPYVLRAIGGR